MHRFMNWREMLQLAPNVKTVNNIMVDYVRSIGPLPDWLPRECRMALDGSLDVQSAAVTLLQAELRFEGPDEARELLHETAHTFASAAVRLTLLHSAPATAA